MKISLAGLRLAIRRVLLEAYEAQEEFYDKTVLPDEEADDDLLAEPDLQKQKERDEYVSRREKKRKKKVRLKSAEETSGAIGDEASMVGGTGGGSIRGHVGGAWGPRQKPKKLKPKNAMGSRSIDEYDE